MGISLLEADGGQGGTLMEPICEPPTHAGLRLGCATRLGLFCQNNRFSCKISRYLYGLSRSQSRPWRLMAFGFVLPKRSYKS
jgi:hypothetical protein